MNLMRAGRVAPVLAAAFAAAACNDGLTDINTNPNAPTNVSAQFLLPSAQQAAIERALGVNFNLTMTGLWSQHWAKVQYIDEDRYDLRPQQVDAHWTGFYAGPLRDLKEIVDQGTEQGIPNWVAIGNVMQAWTFHIMTDVWGDIPYSEALQGDYEDGNIVTPVYDTQQAVYDGMFAQLTAASAGFQTGGRTFGDEDLIYGGDVAAWRRFSNSLRMRLAMRIVLADATKARTQFEAAVAAGGFTSNAHNAELHYDAGPPSANPFYINQEIDGRFDHAISATMVDSLLSLNDPRLPIYATEAPTPTHGAYHGMPNGVDDGFAVELPTRSRIGDFFLAPDAPLFLMTYAEVLFLRAEAAQRGWAAGGTAVALYNAAITASMQQYGISGGDIATYLAQPAVVYNPATGLRQIALQKWIALYGNGPEAFSEWRRTGWPILTPAPASVIGNRVPVRVFYPTIEQSLNKSNHDAAVGRNGGDDLIDPVWWDR